MRKNSEGERVKNRIPVEEVVERIRNYVDRSGGEEGAETVQLGLAIGCIAFIE